MTTTPSELWELFRIDELVKERNISNEAAADIVKAEMEGGLCPYLPSRTEEDPLTDHYIDKSDPTRFFDRS